MPCSRNFLRQAYFSLAAKSCAAALIASALPLPLATCTQCVCVCVCVLDRWVLYINWSYRLVTLKTPFIFISFSLRLTMPTHSWRRNHSPGTPYLVAAAPELWAPHSEDRLRMHWGAFASAVWLPSLLRCFGFWFCVLACDALISGLAHRSTNCGKMGCEYNNEYCSSQYLHRCGINAGNRAFRFYLQTGATTRAEPESPAHRSK